MARPGEVRLLEREVLLAGHLHDGVARRASDVVGHLDAQHDERLLGLGCLAQASHGRGCGDVDGGAGIAQACVARGEELRHDRCHVNLSPAEGRLLEAALHLRHGGVGVEGVLVLQVAPHLGDGALVGALAVNRLALPAQDLEDLGVRMIVFVDALELGVDARDQVAEQAREHLLGG